MHTDFKAIVLTNELNLSKIAQHFGVKLKFKWEDFLLLKGEQLKGIIATGENKQIYLFHFGSMVSVNLQHHEIMDVVRYLKRLELNINEEKAFTYEDDYSLEVSPDEEPAINNDMMLVHEQKKYHTDLVATVIAKSVSLDKSEVEVDALLDKIEAVVHNLSQGNLGVSDSELARMTSEILTFRLDALSSLRLLDNPDITWDNEEASALYQELLVLFELKERYENLRHKTETLMDITDAFSGLAHAKRGTRLEWIIIILIAFEIVLSLYEMFVKSWLLGN